LPGADLVHMDLGLHNVLFRNGEVAAVVDLEGAGRGPVAENTSRARPGFPAQSASRQLNGSAGRHP
jgi:aminoglycoside phosphotransferase (APT) family kinase protein